MISSTEENIWTQVSPTDFRPSEWAGAISAILQALSTPSITLDPEEQSAVKGSILSFEIDQFGNYRISVLPSESDQPTP